MSDFPIALHGERVTAVVIGAGSVGTRKALSLVDAGVSVTVVAPLINPELEHAEQLRKLTIVRDAYRSHHLERATLVIAATDSREVNAQIAVDANARGKLVNITDYPDEGNFHTMALHRSGDITIAVSSGESRAQLQEFAMPSPTALMHGTSVPFRHYAGYGRVCWRATTPAGKPRLRSCSTTIFAARSRTVLSATR